ncbi:hypothetical protein M0R04_12075 [Candidatus Dojkabacteria bacterium]|jgi:formate dehydrogenase assembly factor FdhD|nr:hypothetical protein [Candidatus Dojkabacteria bacterium]
MKLTIKKQLTNNVLEVEIDERDDKEALAKATVFMQKDVCGLCKSDDITWESNKGQNEKGSFTYIKRRCNKCNATSTLGSYKTGGFFWKAFEIYNPNPMAPIGTVQQKPIPGAEPPMTEY